MTDALVLPLTTTHGVICISCDWCRSPGYLYMGTIHVLETHKPKRYT